MSVESIASTPAEIASGGLPITGLRQRIAERRALARQDREAAQLAELHRVRTLLSDAATVVAAGWIQHGWFAYRDEHGRRQLVDAANLHRMAGRRPIGACLVGAVVQAGGGLSAAHSQPVHRALDLSWQVLSGVTEPLDRCPAPAVRLARVRELTAWNDRPQRRVPEVLALLAAARRRVADRLGQAGVPAAKDVLSARR